jgi:small subunit ribosomal protein S20
MMRREIVLINWRMQVANIKSQIKRNRQNDKKRLRNRVYRGEARIAVKNARSNIEEGAPESKAALMLAISALDKAAEQGVIHRNNAARRKSRLVKAFAKMGPVMAVAEPAAGEPALAAEPVTTSSSRGKKAAPRRIFTRKVEEPAAEGAAEVKAEEKAASPKGKKAAEASSSKGKKPAAASSKEKKTKADSSSKEKKAAKATSSPKGKKTTAEK